MPGRSSENLRRSCEILPRFSRRLRLDARGIHEALDYGVVKMNVDTTCNTRSRARSPDHMFKNYDGVLKVDGELREKKVYDPRAYLALFGNGDGRAR